MDKCIKCGKDILIAGCSSCGYSVIGSKLNDEAPVNQEELEVMATEPRRTFFMPSPKAERMIRQIGDYRDPGCPSNRGRYR